MTEWIPLSERPPNWFDVVMFYDSITETITMGYLCKEQWTSIVLFWHGEEFSHVTHWMPLPEPPTIDGQPT